MKTPIAQLIEELQNGFLEDKFNHSSDILLLCVKYQSEEEQHLEKAYDKGYNERYEGEIQRESYFNDTYKP